MYLKHWTSVFRKRVSEMRCSKSALQASAESTERSIRGTSAGSNPPLERMLNVTPT
jgi:hypothetical protein